MSFGSTGGIGYALPADRSARGPALDGTEGRASGAGRNLGVPLQILVARAQDGDRTAFGELYERLAPKIFSYLYHHANGRTELAEDLTADVFLKVLGKLDRYRDRGTPFAAWVYRVAHNRLVDHFRAQPTRGTVPIDDCHHLTETRTEAALDASLTRGVLAEMLQHLTVDQRQVVILRFVQDLSVRETAQAIGRTDDAVKKLQSRGLAALRRALRRRGREPAAC